MGIITPITHKNKLGIPKTSPLENALKSAGKLPIGIAPVINKPTPNQVVNPANVIIKGGNRPFVIPKACTAPTPKPHRHVKTKIPNGNQKKVMPLVLRVTLLKKSLLKRIHLL